MKKYYENDNIKIPRKYWKMSIEELEAEQEAIREKYKSQKPYPQKKPYTGKVKIYL